MLLLRGATILHLVSRGNVGFNTCSSCEEQLFPGVCKGYNERFNTCSSQEEHVLKRETGRTRSFGNASCSSQEEHVLKHRAHIDMKMSPVLLLARGACIETTPYIKRLNEGWGCSSQEEHVLKQRVARFIVHALCCSSQEEHVLKPSLRQTPGTVR